MSRRLSLPKQDRQGFDRLSHRLGGSTDGGVRLIIVEVGRRLRASEAGAADAPPPHQSPLVTSARPKRAVA
ncbi:hypothetical protein SAMN06266982_101234 [Propioniciclava tarda]|nr:hypothetical protein SAMN06266982_101234 [Propioniciclava tarda]